MEFENAFYHVASRGINRQNLFCDLEDNIVFMRLLRKMVFKYNIRLFAFCLMSNHYHLYFSSPNANLSIFIKALNQSYAIYFLKKYPEKDGTVYKGRYMRKLVEKDRYSLALIAYIHNNPYKLIDEVQDWSYSSYSSYLDSTERFDFIDYNFGLTGFAGSVQKFKSFHDEMRKAEWNPEDHTVAKSFIGSKEFAKNIIQEHLSLDQIYNEEILGMNFFRNKPFASSSFPVFGLRPAFLT
ncbi:MAG: transposase [Cyanobacteria bacterium]|nr:transposase [Cyanobacteriota bacterium]